MTTQELLARENQCNAKIREKLLNKGTHDYVGQTREGLTSVRDGSEWYHVDEEDRPISSRRFKFAGTFYDGTAPVQDDLGWFHIYANGTDIYSQRTPFQDRAHLIAVLARECEPA